MYKKLSLLTIALGTIFLGSMFIIALSGSPVVDAQVDAIPDWVGSDTCIGCHGGIGDQQALHGHSYKLNRVDGAAPEYPHGQELIPPEGYTWDDISFVIGGFAWKARFVDSNGYIITGDENATTQYNFPLIDERTGAEISPEGWVGYHAGEVDKPYNCGSCHTTAYNHDSSTNMDGLPGLIGEWQEEGIQCEECHGPGSLHVEEPIRVNMLRDRAAEACGDCHYRGDIAVLDASGPFVKHHEQYEEILTAPHAAMECIDCHDPHQSVQPFYDPEVNPARGMRTSCNDCHFDTLNSEDHIEEGVTCIDCHMPPMTASGNRNEELLWGDLRTHLYQINTDVNASQFEEDGSIASFITLEYACTRCHSDWTVEEMAEEADDYHDHDDDHDDDD